MVSSTLSRLAYNIHEVSAVNRQEQSSEPIRAYVVLKGKAGDLMTPNEPVSANNIEAYTADPSVREQVRTQLEDLGLSVRHVSPLSIAVEAAPEQFENIFHGRLKKIEDSDKTVGGWTWSRSPKIPVELSDKIDTVVLPQPTRLLSSE
jgi:hypothetical protein